MSDPSLCISWEAIRVAGMISGAFCVLGWVTTKEHGWMRFWYGIWMGGWMGVLFTPLMYLIGARG